MIGGLFTILVSIGSALFTLYVLDRADSAKERDEVTYRRYAKPIDSTVLGNIGVGFMVAALLILLLSAFIK